MAKETAMELEELPSDAEFGTFTFGDLANPAENQNDLVIDIASNAPPRPDPFVLAFNNLTYEVKIGGKSRFPWSKSSVSPDNNSTNTKTLLNNISGEAKEGEIMAIFGPSGSGKSTLLDAIANRIDRSSLRGSITMNDKTLEPEILKFISAYVMQDDVLFPMLTVEETLMFSAEFRLPQSFSKEKKKARVQALIDQLGLRNAANTVIGDEAHRGVSGGERRRVSIGIDIIHDPILLFLDEPTSSLDSSSALMVIKVLQGIAQSGSIVMMSIHQPSSRIVGLLDRMMFLSRGNIMYNGTPGDLPRFFHEFGQPFPDINGNPCEFALEQIRDLEQSALGTQKLVEFNKSWQASMNSGNDGADKTTLSLEDAIKRCISQGKLVIGDQKQSSSGTPSFANPFWFEVLVLFKRLAINSKRMPEVFGFRLVTLIITATIIGTLFWQVDNSPTGVQERLGCLAISISTIIYTCTTETPEFIRERFIFTRETAYNAYRRSSYVVARSLISIPPLIAFGLTFSLIAFWCIGLAGGFWGFFFFFLVSVATFWAGSSLVALITSVIPNHIVAFVIGIAMGSYYLFFCGFLVARDRLPKYWLWLHYMSVSKYPYEAFLQNEFRHGECFARGSQVFDQSSIRSLPVSTKDELLKSMGNVLKMNLTESTCVTTGSDVLKLHAITQLNKWECLCVIFAWGVLFRILSYLSLSYGNKNKRK